MLKGHKNVVQLLLIITVLIGVCLLFALLPFSHKSKESSTVTKKASTKLPKPKLGAALPPPGDPSKVPTITLEEAKAKAPFKLMLPDPKVLPEGYKLQLIIVQPTPWGDGYCFFYNHDLMETSKLNFFNSLEIAIEPENRDYIDVEYWLKETYKPDLRREKEELAYQRFEVNGIPAAGHDPRNQILRDGSGWHVPAVLIFYLPGSGDIKKIRYRISAPHLPVSKLIEIAESLK
jgi:hypothetical protein